MRTKHILIISAVVLFSLGLEIFIMPERTLLTQLFGIILIAFALLNWFVRNVEEHRLRPIIVANLLFYLFGFVVLLVNYLTGSQVDVVWLTSGLFLVMTLAFWYAYCCLEVWEYLTGKLS